MKMFRIQTLNNFCIKSLCPDNSFRKSSCMTTIDPYVGNRVTLLVANPYCAHAHVLLRALKGCRKPCLMVAPVDEQLM